MKAKLLNKTLRSYAVLSVLVLVVSAPICYLLTEGLVAHEAEEVLFLHKDEFVKESLPAIHEENIPAWNAASRDTKIQDQPEVSGDSLFRQFYRDPLSDEDVPYRVLLSPVTIDGKSKTLMVRASMIESRALINNIAVLFCLIMVLLLTGLYLMTRFLQKRIWKPFYSVIEQLEEFELDKSRMPDLPAADIEEFDRLNRSTSNLLKKNLAIFQSQKEFIENAAHELQTPLASLQAKLDVLIQEVDLSNNVGTAFSALHDSVARINRLNKNLLLLSKIENNQYETTEMVAVDSIVKKQTAFIREQIVENGIQLQSEDVRSLTVRTNLALLEVAIGNLLLNALKHNQTSGLINVKLLDKRLTVSNSGATPLLPDARLFKRFSATASSGGSGLGLAIVKKICDLNGWKLEYSFDNGFHAFMIAF